MNPETYLNVDDTTFFQGMAVVSLFALAAILGAYRARTDRDEPRGAEYIDQGLMKSDADRYRDAEGSGMGGLPKID